MGAIDKIFKVIEGSQNARAIGTGVDVTDLVGSDLLDSTKGDAATVAGAVDLETRKPIIGATVKKNQAEFGVAGSGSTDLGLGAKYTSKDESTSAALSASKGPQGKNILFTIGRNFKTGGEVEIGKGKDYIKDLI